MGEDPHADRRRFLDTVAPALRPPASAWSDPRRCDPSWPSRPESRTRPGEVVERQEGAAEPEEGGVDVGSALVADGEAAHLVQVRERALDDPAMAAQASTRVDPAARDAGLDATGAERSSRGGEVVGFVRVELGGAAARTTGLAAHRRHGVEQGREDGDLVAVARRDQCGERDALPVGEEVALRRRAGAVRRVGPGLSPPWYSHCWRSCRLAVAW
jgi:hypothetical protein